MPELRGLDTLQHVFQLAKLENSKTMMEWEIYLDQNRSVKMSNCMYMIGEKYAYK